jgi:hypothetical protein
MVCLAASSASTNGDVLAIIETMDKNSASERKMSTRPPPARLDFNDLLYTARDVLAGHDPVRQSLTPVPTRCG